jgi:hypothetical protein
LQVDERELFKVQCKNFFVVWSAQLTLLLEIYTSLMGTITWCSGQALNIPGRREQKRQWWMNHPGQGDKRVFALVMSEVIDPEVGAKK